jgi:hypothetical protein
VLTDDDRVLEVLDQVECRRLLGTERVGRLGFTHGALPAVLPVPFTLDGGSIRIPAREGHWVVRAVRRSVVAFVVDSYDPDARTGWGVTAVGATRVVLDRPTTTGGCTIVVDLGLLRGWRLDLRAAPAGPHGHPSITA